MKFLHLLFILLPLTIASCLERKKEISTSAEQELIIDYKGNNLGDLRKSAELNEILCQHWELADDATDAASLDITSSLDVVYRGYNFFKDGSVTKDPRGNVKIGTWSSEKKGPSVIIKNTFSNGGREQLKLAFLESLKMIFVSEPGTVKLEYSGPAVNHLNPSEDPFYPKNLLWRIPPVKSETNAQLKQRLKDCIHFFVLFYDNQINTQSRKVTFVGLPTCFRWHAGGIFLQKKPDISKRWLRCFFNDEQAMKAYHFAGELLKKKYNWPKKGNWLELNVAVLRQMEMHVDELK